MRRHSGPQNRRDAAAVVEFALVMTFILVPLLLGMWEIARILEIQQVISAAAEQGARLASSGEKTNTEVVTAVRTYLQSLANYGIPAAAGTNATITVTNVTSGLDSKTAGSLNRLDVVVGVRYGDVRWSPINVLFSDTTELRTRVSFLSCKDDPLTDTSFANFPWP